MSVEIPVRRIPFKSYILEFVVTDPGEVRVSLLSDKDPTMVDTQYITIATSNFLSDEYNMDHDAFAVSVYSKATAWADSAIVADKDSRTLANALGRVLPRGIEKD
jgi:hypothetical protein